MSNSVQSEFKKIIYTVAEKKFNYEKCAQIFEDVRGNFELEEIELLVKQYFVTKVPNKGSIINKRLNAYTNLTTDAKNEFEQAIYNSDIIKLSLLLYSRQEILNYPILISKENIIFGVKDIKSFLRLEI